MNTDKIYAESIASEYAPKQTSKVVALKKLDRQAKLGANIFTYSFGIISALVLGLGMCLSMNVIGSGGTAMMVLGILNPVTGALWHNWGSVFVVVNAALLLQLKDTDSAN